MTDDRSDQELAARLRAYESRIPETHAPAPGSGRERRSGLAVLLAGGTAALAAVVLALVVLQGWSRDQVADPGPTPSLAASVTGSPSAEPHASTTPVATPSPGASERPAPPVESPPSATTDLAWSETGTFPSDGNGPSIVEHLVAVEGGYVAAGVAYKAQLPNVGPTPAHTLRVWLSRDGRTWEQAESQLENVEFTSLVVRGDGLLLATGLRGIMGENEESLASEEHTAWTSPDGRTWVEASIGMPTVPTTIVRGAQGYVALARPDPINANHDFELWHSPDGISWSVAHDGVADLIDLEAGDEGFVAVGGMAAGGEQPFALASGDGREWFVATTPPPALWPHVAPVGGDWIAISAFDATGGMDHGETWASANGLDWEPHGQAPMGGVEADGRTCDEFPQSLLSPGPWLVAGTDLSYPCSEGRFVVHGTQLISVDGAAWSPLPFRVGTPGVTRSGAGVNAAITTEDALLLAGELDGVATFWIGEQK
jgi:hypothetical protein